MNETVYDEEEDGEEATPLKTITNNGRLNGKSNGVNNQAKKVANKSGGLFSSLKSLVGAKVLTQESIAPVMEKMQDHLICGLLI